MGTLEEIKNMQRQGMSEEQIIQSLRDRNVSYKDISEGLAQSKIRAAIQDNEVPSPQSYDQNSQQYNQYPPQQEGMQQSLMSSPDQVDQYQQIPQQAQEQPQQYPQQYQEYPQYQDSGLSTDTITEISEQIVSSKMSELRKQLEKTLDMKSTIETKMDSIDERLKRLEKIIDTLQSSVLRKVGDYVTNVEDIKREIIETQKTFSKLVNKK